MMSSTHTPTPTATLAGLSLGAGPATGPANTTANAWSTISEADRMAQEKMKKPRCYGCTRPLVPGAAACAHCNEATPKAAAAAAAAIASAASAHPAPRSPSPERNTKLRGRPAAGGWRARARERADSNASVGSAGSASSMDLAMSPPGSPRASYTAHRRGSGHSPKSFASCPRRGPPGSPRSPPRVIKLPRSHSNNSDSGGDEPKDATFTPVPKSFASCPLHQHARPANPDRATDNKTAYAVYTKAIKAIEADDAHRLAQVLPARVAHNCDFGAWPQQKQLLHWAAQHSATACCDVLVGLGCDPAHRNKDGSTSLHVAAFYDNTAVVARLLANPGANPGARNKHGETCMHAALAGQEKRGAPSASVALLAAAAAAGPRGGLLPTPTPAAAAAPTRCGQRTAPAPAPVPAPATARAPAAAARPRCGQRPTAAPVAVC